MKLNYNLTTKNNILICNIEKEIDEILRNGKIVRIKVSEGNYLNDLFICRRKTEYNNKPVFQIKDECLDIRNFKADSFEVIMCEYITDCVCSYEDCESFKRVEFEITEDYVIRRTLKIQIIIE